ncbi:MAG: hypothetical protein RL338_259 [Chloroflexota bacterium]
MSLRPAVVPPDHRAMPLPGPCPAVPGDAPCRVLLVADHRAATTALGAHLRRHGFHIVGLEAAPAAVRAAAARELPDVVLIDASVGGGWQAVVSALDSISPHRVAVLAAYWGSEARRDAAEAGIGATLLKQVSGGDLVARLRALAVPRASGAAAADGPAS